MIRKIGVLLFAGSVFYSCTTDSLVDIPFVDREEILFSYVTPKLTKGTSLNLQEETLSRNLGVGLHIVANQKYDCYLNVEAKADEMGNLTVPEKLFYPLKKDEKVAAYAYAPFQAHWNNVNALHTFRVALDQSTDSAFIASDLLLGAPTENPFRTSGKVNFSFSHSLTKIIAVVAIEPQLSLCCDSIEINMLNVLTECGITIPTAEVSAGRQYNNIKMATLVGLTADEIGTASGPIEKACCAIVVPQIIPEGKNLFKIKLSDGRECIKTTQEAIPYTSGQVVYYRLNITSSCFDSLADENMI